MARAVESPLRRLAVVALMSLFGIAVGGALSAPPTAAASCDHTACTGTWTIVCDLNPPPQTPPSFCEWSFDDCFTVPCDQ